MKYQNIKYRVCGNEFYGTLNKPGLKLWIFVKHNVKESEIKKIVQNELKKYKNKKLKYDNLEFVPAEITFFIYQKEKIIHIEFLHYRIILFLNNVIFFVWNKILFRKSNWLRFIKSGDEFAESVYEWNKIDKLQRVK